MRRVIRLPLLFSCVVGSGPTAQAQPTYDLSLEPAVRWVYARFPGQTMSADFCAVVTSGGDHQGQGAQAWSLSISSQGGCEIVSATTDGTAGEGADFAETHLTREVREAGDPPDGNPDAGCPDGKDGVVSAVVLKFGKPPVKLPIDRPSELLKLTVECRAPGPLPPDNVLEPLGRISYIDGCEGLGEPVENGITWQGETIVPSLAGAEIHARPHCDCFHMPLALIVQAEPLVADGTGDVPAETSALFDGMLTPDVDYDVYVDIETAAGAIGQTTIWAAIVSQLENMSPPAADGAQGWSLSGRYRGNIHITGATTDGTAGSEADFAETQLTAAARGDPPDLNPAAGCPGGTDGVTSAVVLKFGKPPVFLQNTGTATVLGLDIESTIAVEEDAPVTGGGVDIGAYEYGSR